MQTPSKIIVIGDDKLPIWRLVIGGLAFSILIYFLIEGIIDLYQHPSIASGVKLLISQLYNIGLYLPVALAFATTITKYFDLSNKSLTKVYGIGPFKKKITREIHNLDYVQIYHPSKNSFIELRIWYYHKGHRTIDVGRFTTKEDAIEYGKYLAQLLKIELIYTIRPGNSETIEVENTATAMN